MAWLKTVIFLWRLQNYRLIIGAGKNPLGGILKADLLFLGDQKLNMLAEIVSWSIGAMALGTETIELMELLLRERMRIDDTLPLTTRFAWRQTLLDMMPIIGKCFNVP